jgi:glycerophosphoryl diester phosphodiesterase
MSPTAAQWQIMAHHTYPYLDAATPLAFAHRGGAALGTENTGTAFDQAVALGYRYIETDTQASSDGVAVVFHDNTLARMTGDRRRIGDLRWADLATLRVGGEAALPRLDDVLDAWPKVRFNIDVKAENAITPTLDAVRGAGALDRVLLASFSDARLARIRRELGPTVATSMGVREVTRLWANARLGRRQRVPEGVVAAQIPVRQSGIRVLTRRLVTYAHRLGLQVHVWTIDDPAEMNDLLDLGVDGIMTDRVEVLRDVYSARGRWAA